MILKYKEFVLNEDRFLDKEIENVKANVTIPPGKEAEVINLITQLYRFDWSYEMSDDSRAWRKGEQQKESIKDLIESLGDLGKQTLNIYLKHNKTSNTMFYGYFKDWFDDESKILFGKK